jgi:hypothetical protein
MMAYAFRRRYFAAAFSLAYAAAAAAFRCCYAIFVLLADVARLPMLRFWRCRHAMPPCRRRLIRFFMLSLLIDISFRAASATAAAASAADYFDIDDAFDFFIRCRHFISFRRHYAAAMIC